MHTERLKFITVVNNYASHYSPFASRLLLIMRKTDGNGITHIIFLSFSCREHLKSPSSLNHRIFRIPGRGYRGGRGGRLLVLGSAVAVLVLQVPRPRAQGRAVLLGARAIAFRARLARLQRVSAAAAGQLGAGAVFRRQVSVR